MIELSVLQGCRTRARPAREPLSTALLFASVLATTIIAGTWSTALRAASDPPRAGWFTPACAAEDLSALVVIEERGEVIGTSTKQLAEAGLLFLEARRLCLSGQESEGIALYKSAINTAFGFQAPAVDTVERAPQRRFWDTP